MGLDSWVNLLKRVPDPFQQKCWEDNVGTCGSSCKIVAELSTLRQENNPTSLLAPLFKIVEDF